MFVTAVPGLARLVEQELASKLPVADVLDTGFDGRSDVVLFEVPPAEHDKARGLRSTEDLFVEVGRTLRHEGDNPRWIAGRVWRAGRVRRALQVWSEETKSRTGRLTFRVIARVLHERTFLRTELRRQLTAVIRKERPSWEVADPPRLEVWITEYRPGRFVVGLRVSDVHMRQHEGRAVERRGALRPTVAAAMVHLAGRPGRRLLDPCCGSGTILEEAADAGWSDIVGIDIDPRAVQVARENAKHGKIDLGDARHLELPDASADAVVSNLPFGQQYAVEGRMDQWRRAVLTEIARVTRGGGRVVLLAPRISREVISPGLRLDKRCPITLLGTRTTIWTFDRVG